jgi:hypothetical protein
MAGPHHLFSNADGSPEWYHSSQCWCRQPAGAELLTPPGTRRRWQGATDLAATASANPKRTYGDISAALARRA